jgi:hypothetical protein
MIQLLNEQVAYLRSLVKTAVRKTGSEFLIFKSF